MAEINADGLGKKTRYIFSSPKSYVSIFIIFLISSTIGILFVKKIDGGIIFGLVSIALPAYISSIFVYFIKELLRIRYRIKTEIFLSSFLILLSLISFTFILTFVHIAKIEIETEKALLFSVSAPLWLRHVYLSSVIETKQKKSILLTLPYIATLLIFLGIMLQPDTKNLALFLLFITISLLSAYIFLKAADEPMRRLFGIGGLEFTRWMIEHYKERTEYGKKRLEELFDRLGEKLIIVGKTISFWDEGLYGVLNVNTAHPGPIGEIGGGNMPKKLSEFIDCKNLILPHGTSIHDLNPVTTGEVKKLAEKILSSLNGKDVKATRSIKIDDDIEVMAQRFGDYLLVAESSSKYGTEDIDPSVSFLLEEKIKEEGYRGLIFIDAHNYLPDKGEETFVYSPKYELIEKNVLKAASLLKDESLYPADVGIGKYNGVGMDEGVGPMGIISLVIRVNSQTTAYTVIDGNNMIKGLRNRIIRELEKIVDNAEVMTTDNHYVNMTYGGDNPIGKNGKDEIIKGCIKSVEKGLKDLHECKLKLGEFNTQLKVMGAGKAAKLLSVSEPYSHNLRDIAFLTILSMVSLDIIFSIFI